MNSEDFTLGKKVTVLIPTTVGPSAPSTKLIEYTMDSANKRLLGNEPVRYIVHYDIWDESPVSLKYLDNLRDLNKERGFDFIYGSRGLSCAMRKMIPMVDTDYYLFLEHDWEFVKDMDLEAIIRMMDSHPDVNYIRFNKRKNVIKGCDTILEPYSVEGVDLLKNDNWSANPHIGRTRTFKEKWLRYLPSEPQKGPFMEQYINKAYQDDIISKGFEDASGEWGVFVYGKIGDGRVVRHLDGDKWKGTGMLNKIKMWFEKL